MKRVGKFINKKKLWGFALFLIVVITWAFWWMTPHQPRWVYRGLDPIPLGFYNGGKLLSILEESGHNSQREVFLFDAANGDIKFKHLLDAKTEAQFTPDGSKIILTEEIAKPNVRKNLRIIDVPSGKELYRLDEIDLWNSREALSPDSNKIVFSIRKRREGVTALWDLKKRGEPIYFSTEDAVWSEGLCFSPDSQILAIGTTSQDGEFQLKTQISIIDVESGKQINRLPDTEGVPVRAVFSSNKELLAASFSINRVNGAQGIATKHLIKVWRLGDQKEIFEAKDLFNPHFFSDNKTLLADVQDPVTNLVDLKVWDTSNGQEIKKYPLLDSQHSRLRKLSEEDRLTFVHVQTVTKGSITRWFDRLIGKIERFQSSHQIDQVKVLDLQTGQEDIWSTRIPTGSNIVISPDGKSMLTPFRDLYDRQELIRVWDIPPKTAWSRWIGWAAVVGLITLFANALRKRVSLRKTH